MPPSGSGRCHELPISPTASALIHATDPGQAAQLHLDMTPQCHIFAYSGASLATLQGAMGELAAETEVGMGLDSVCVLDHGFLTGITRNLGRFIDAKKADAWRRIVFTRRSSRFSRSSSASRLASLLDAPGRRPPSISAYPTQVLNASGCTAQLVGHPPDRSRCP